ncbi:MAG: RNA ligase family protein [Blastocatellia bacterium]
MDLLKYPRTQHIEGSRLQPGDEDLDSVSFEVLKSKPIVVEEKLDGANSGISFGTDGRLYLQSRGHFLDGGPREKHFALFKTWANTHKRALWEALGSRYVMYGEWLYAKHTVFYDRLPHYFMEFDLLDRQKREFLSTERRHELVSSLPVASVPVLYKGPAIGMEHTRALVRRSLYKSDNWKDRLAAAAQSQGIDVDRVITETDQSETMEGLYIKNEEGGIVSGRFKYIRLSFLTSVFDSGSHWLERPIVPNQLADGVDIFEVRS